MGYRCDFGKEMNILNGIESILAQIEDQSSLKND